MFQNLPCIPRECVNAAGGGGPNREAAGAQGHSEDRLVCVAPWMVLQCSETVIETVKPKGLFAWCENNGWSQF